MDLPAYVNRVVLLPDLTYNYLCRFDSLSNYAQRVHIAKEEILTTMRAISNLKSRSEQLSDRTYFSQRMWKLMMTCFYVVCSVLRNEKLIAPSFSKRELRDFMQYPIPFSTMWSFPQWRLRHLALYLLGVMPSWLSILLVKLVAKRKGLI